VQYGIEFKGEKMRTLFFIALCLVLTRHADAEAQSQDSMRLIQEGRREYLEGQYANAEKLFLNALRVLDRNDENQRALVLAELGDTYLSLDSLFESERAYTASLAIYRRLAKTNDEQAGDGFAIVLRNLGAVYSLERRDADALRVFREALTLMERKGPRYAAAKAQVLNGIGIVYYRQGKNNKAEEFFNKALEAVSGSDIAFDSSEILNNLGTVYHAKGNFQKAEDFLLRALQIAENRFGYAHPELIFTLSELALFCSDAKRYTEAEGYLQRALKILRPRGPQFDTRVARLLHALGAMYIKAGRPDDAELALVEAAAIARRNLGEHPDLAPIVEAYSAVLKKHGRTKEAEDLRVEAKQARVRSAVVIHALSGF
jgi:tetratricopeptide (TPR) repeat protein